MVKAARGLACFLVCAAVAACSDSDSDPGSTAPPPPPEPDCTGVPCSPCGSPLTMLVVDGVVNGPVAGVTVQGVAGFCNEGQSSTICRLGSSATGAMTYEFDLVAPGYRTSHLVETVDPSEPGGCCNCGYDKKTVGTEIFPL